MGGVRREKVRVRRSVPLLRLKQREEGSGADLCGVEIVVRKKPLKRVRTGSVMSRTSRSSRVVVRYTLAELYVSQHYFPCDMLDH